MGHVVAEFFFFAVFLLAILMKKVLVKGVSRYVQRGRIRYKVPYYVQFTAAFVACAPPEL